MRPNREPLAGADYSVRDPAVPSWRRRSTVLPVSLYGNAPRRSQRGEFLQPVLLTVGVLVMAVGAFMILPALVDLVLGHEDWIVFAASSAIAIFIGGSLFLANRAPPANLTVRQAFLVTTLSWVAACAAGMMPFLFTSMPLTFADAFFESVSGLTTTGATVIVGLDTAPAGLLLWRSLLHWLGGLGIVVTAVAVLPILRVGGMQIFRMESSDRSEKLYPRASQIAKAIAITYLTLTALNTVLLVMAGISWFDAINHAMSTVATGGFSTHDASIGYFQNPFAEVITIVFMLAGSLPLLFYVRQLTRRNRRDVQDHQVPAFLWTVAFFALSLFLWRLATSDDPFLLALRQSAFNVVSVITTTGFATTDYGLWGGFANGLFLILFFVGGCTGSTTGSIKIFRWQVIHTFLRAQIHKSISPNRVSQPVYHGVTLPDSAVSSVLAFITIYLITYGLLTFVFSLTGYDLVTSATAVASAITNVGPGLGPIIGPAGNFASLSDPAKWLLSAGMLLGRLEIFTVIVLFTRSFWKH